MSRKEFALDRTGYGASIKGQRWNSAGIPTIYAGLSLEIAALEKLVHTGSILPLNLMVVRITLPDDNNFYKTPPLDALPDDWNTLPGSPTAAAYGDSFLRKGKYLGLIVPSAVILEARNIVINPNHPAMKEVEIEIVRDFTFDSRLRS
ncbi:MULTISPECIES: RES family NAD+ phosphorylase [Nitrosomonas]|nr:RES family NAD+ phosphorylase [Nitrosomonas eutropha]MXS81405.1 RES domain-containing protein [Nitrosomonas sp. GH22]